MSEERLVVFQQLQVSGSQLHTYAKAKTFEESIVGFYLRLKDSSSSASSVGVIEGIRLGRAYSIPDIKYCTKHLLVHQPPHPKRTFRLTEVSDEPFTLADLEQWEANMAILRLPVAHKFDLTDAERRRVEMSPPEATKTPAASEEKKLHSTSEPRSLSSKQKSEKTSSPLSHIAMFEERARGAAEEEQQRLEKRKSASHLSRFLPPRASKPAEVVKASESGATRLELASPKGGSKVSLLARTFESSPRDEQPVSPSDRSRRATVIGLPALSLTQTKSDLSDKSSPSSEASTPTPSPSSSSTTPANRAQEEMPTPQALASPSTKSADVSERQEEESDVTEEPEQPTSAKEGKTKQSHKGESTSSAEQTPTSSTPTTPETERREHTRMKSARGKKRKSRVSSTDDVTPRRTSSDTPERDKRRKHSATTSRPGSTNLDLDLDLPSPTESRSHLSSPDVTIRSPNSKKKRKRNSKKRPSRRLKATSVEASAEAVDVLGSMRMDNNDDDSFLQDSARTPPLQLDLVTGGSSKEGEGSVNVRSSADDINKPTDPSPRFPHRRHVSCEDVSKENLTRDILPSPRSVNLDMHHVLSRIIIPMSSLDGDWESKKIRHFEKQARQHAKEKDILELENEGVTTRMKTDTDGVVAALEVKHAQERKALDRKIQNDQNTLNELISQEKKLLTRTLAREKELADEKLTEQHAREEKRQAEDFEKQMAQIRKAGVPGDESENALLAHLRRAHDTEKKRQTRQKDLNQLQSVHRHEQAKVKRIQEQQRKHVEMQQALARETLILQLSLSQRQMRQKRWSLLDDIQSRENTSRSMQEKRQQMELRHEAAAQELALKLLRKQQGMERESLNKSKQNQLKQDNAALQKQKKALKANLAATTKKLQRDKTLAKEDVKERVEKMKSEFDHNISHVEETFKAMPDLQNQISVVETRHEQQIHDFEKERTRRRDVLLLYHQQQKNDLQTRLEEERRQMEATMKENMDAFQQEEITMKEAFTEAHDTCLWDIQQRHWQESSKLQSMHHEEQQEFMKAVAVQAKSADLFQKPSPRPVSEDSDAQEASEVERQKEEEERLRLEEEARREAEEEEALQRELQRQLQEQQEAEKRQLEQEREAEQERLRAQLEEEKKEVMQTTIKEDESTLRAEYIRKIALETGLSEELIAAQIDRIGIPSFMF